MVTVIIGRELLVTTIRAMVEGQGGDFSAKWLGKWKMLLQCSAIVSSMLALHLSSNYAWLAPVNITLIWLALLLTILSGIDYVVKAVRLSQMR
jgi:CDP-diacylglycerol--glycerol-3-phosphate 3-phosphatidyltransferase